MAAPVAGDPARMKGRQSGHHLWYSHSIVDSMRQWFKARIGFEPCETSRDVSFCEFVILTPGTPFTVPHTHLDPRFRNNPLVLNASCTIRKLLLWARAGPTIWLPTRHIMCIGHAATNAE